MRVERVLLVLVLIAFAAGLVDEALETAERPPAECAWRGLKYSDGAALASSCDEDKHCTVVVCRSGTWGARSARCSRAIDCPPDAP
jgi:hypothetical protein